MQLSKAGNSFNDWIMARAMSLCVTLNDGYVASVLLRPDVPAGTAFTYVPATNTTPAYFFSFGPQVGVILVLGASNFNLAYGLYTNYSLTGAEATVQGVNPFVATAASTIFNAFPPHNFTGSYALYIGGYSMGAAVAVALADAIFRTQPINEPEITVCGMPMPGNTRFKNRVVARHIASYFNEGDPIPYLPGDQELNNNSLFGGGTGRVAPEALFTQPVVSTMLLKNFTSERVGNPPKVLLPNFSLAITGWAVGVLWEPVKAHLMSTYESFLYSKLVKTAVFLPPSISGVDPQQVPGPIVPDDPPTPPAALPPEVIPPTYVAPPLPTYNPSALSGQGPGRRRRFVQSTSLPFNAVRLNGRWYVAHYGSLLWVVPGGSRARKLAGKLNSVVASILTSGVSDPNSLSTSFQYEIGVLPSI